MEKVNAIIVVSKIKQQLKVAAKEAGAAANTDLFYRPMKKEKVSESKKLLLRKTDADEVFVMSSKDAASKFKIKIPGEVHATSVPNFVVFVQSTSPNRNLEPGQEFAFVSSEANSEAKPSAKKKGKKEEDTLSKLFYSLPEDQRGLSFEEKYRGKELPNGAAFLAKVLEKNLKESDSDEKLFLGMRTVLHAEVLDVDIWNPSELEGVEENGKKRTFPYHNKADDFDPSNLGKTKFGGVPHLPDSLAHYGRRSDFICQFDCEFLAQYDLRGVLPTQGFLWFWHSLEYVEEHPVVVRYFPGPRQELKPRIQSIEKALPVYFVTGIRTTFDDSLGKKNGPALFYYEELDCNPEDRFSGGRHPSFEAAMTLLMIRNYRDSIFSKMPKDVVRLIAKELYNSKDDRAWEREDWKEWQEKHRVDNDSLFPFYSLGLDDCCGYAHSCFYAGPVIQVEKALAGKWFESFGVGNTD